MRLRKPHRNKRETNNEAQSSINLISKDVIVKKKSIVKKDLRKVKSTRTNLLNPLPRS